MGMFTEHCDEEKIPQVWLVHYSQTGKALVFKNKESALAHIRKNRGMEESVSSHGEEIVFHYATNYNTRLYPQVFMD